MNDKNTATADDERKIKSIILRTLESRGKKARFVTELAAALARSGLAPETLEPALTELAGEGVIMVRDHFCADPHLAGVDLRVAALVQSSAGADAQMSAICAIDEAWDKWLAEYLSNHRCG
ncbi:MAG TPA: hypothetical protein VIH18_16155 [Candidatus Binatia bacterium]